MSELWQVLWFWPTLSKLGEHLIQGLGLEVHTKFSN